MPSVLEIPEVEENDQERPAHDAVEVTLALHPSFVNKITGLLAGITTVHRQQLPRNQKQEMRADILAREHPYIYIKALAG